MKNKCLLAASWQFDKRLARQLQPGTAKGLKSASVCCFVLTIMAGMLLPGKTFAATVAGTTPGKMSVSTAGLPKYEIPISVPPGAAGMAPELAFTHNGSRKNGPLGIGWSLSGLSTIYRCPQTIAQDGTRGGIDLSAEDRFCFDGQRLVAIAGGYGANGTEYRTEIDSFARVISHGRAGTGPLYFTVETKDGRILTFGQTANARVVQAGVATVRLWALNRVADRSGNYMVMSYANDTTNHSFEIERITYSGHEGQGVLPPSRVQFVYEDRQDKRSRYLGGTVLQNRQRLKRIETWTDETLVRRYQLSYHDDTVTRLSRLASVTECDGGTQCLAPLTFDWAAEPAGFAESPGFALPHGAGPLDRHSFFTDLNGDGLLDYIYGNSATRKAWLNTGSGWQESAAFQPPVTFWDGDKKRAVLVDVNGDELQDLVLAYAADTAARATWLNTGSGWKRDAGFQPPFQLSYDLQQWYDRERCRSGGEDGKECSWYHVYYTISRDLGQFVDLDGDGLDDFVSAYQLNASTVKKAWRNTGTGWEEAPALTPPGLAVLYNDYADSAPQRMNEPTASYTAMREIGEFVDIDGDGRADLVQAFGATKTTWLNTPAGWQAAPDYLAPFYLGFSHKRYYSLGTCRKRKGEQICTKRQVEFTDGRSYRGVFVDLNGDGLLDRLQAIGIGRTPKNYFNAWLNTGAGWQESLAYRPPVRNYYFWESGSTFRLEAELHDINADGLPDYIQSIGNTRRTWLNSGSGWVASPIHQAAADLHTYWPESPLGRQLSSITHGALLDLDGDGLLDIVSVVGNTRKAFLAGKGSVRQISRITDSLGRTTVIDYRPLTDPGVYSKGEGAVFPEVDLRLPLQVVSGIAEDDGVGGQARKTYRYQGLRFHRQGRRTLGFAAMAVRDQQTGIETLTRYRQDFPFIGRVSGEQRRFANGTQVSALTHTWKQTRLNAAKSVLPQLAAIRETTYEINDGPGNLPVTVITENRQYDNFGNIVESAIKTEGGGETFTWMTRSIVSNDTDRWLLGQLRRVEQQRSLPDGRSLTRVSAFDYAVDSGLLIQEVIEPDNPELQVTTDYRHDAFGNVHATTVSGGDIETRASTDEYTADGRFLRVATNAVGHAEQRRYDTRFGSVQRRLDANDVVTVWRYDGFGRPLAQVHADGTETRWSYALCTVQCPHNAVYAVQQQDVDAAGDPIDSWRIEYFDRRDRVIRTETQGFDGKAIFTDTVFDPRGNVAAVSRPYFAGTAAAAIPWTTTDYDLVNRVTVTTQADGGRETNDYDGLITTRINALEQREIRRHDALGRVAAITDNVGTEIEYGYDPFGHLDSVDVGAIATQIQYDTRGRRLLMDDPDMGLWRYRHNVLGELVSQVDAKNQQISLHYDALGRLIRRTEDEGTTEWVYDTAANGIGKLHRTDAPHNGYALTHEYDHLARPSATTMTIAGASYTTQIGYGNHGRIDTQRYPSGFAVNYWHNARGFLSAVTDIGGEIFWQADSVNADGEVTRATLGNDVVSLRQFNPETGHIESITSSLHASPLQKLAYEFDSLGNLKRRTDLLQGREEAFDYDGINRLVLTSLRDTASHTPLASTDYRYDLFGNLEYKSDMGDYRYGEGSAGPHAVTRAGAFTYRYDANGNMVEGAGRRMDYASFNKPVAIVDGDNRSAFVYGPDRGRIQQQVITAGQSYDVVYIGTLYERRMRAGLADELVHYIRANDTVAIHTVIDDGRTATDKTRYLHRDHLGSIDTISDERGQKVMQLSYDPHGKRRLPDWLAGTPVDAAAETPRGFTGHEHLDGVGLIHMNGRVYDPALGRFISADPFVPDIETSKGFNRYAYVNDNPLSYTDPSGFFPSNGNSSERGDSDTGDDRGGDSDEGSESEPEDRDSLDNEVDGAEGDGVQGDGSNSQKSKAAQKEKEESNPALDYLQKQEDEKNRVKEKVQNLEQGLKDVTRWAAEARQRQLDAYSKADELVEEGKIEEAREILDQVRKDIHEEVDMTAAALEIEKGIKAGYDRINKIENLGEGI